MDNQYESEVDEMLPVIHRRMFASGDNHFYRLIYSCDLKQLERFTNAPTELDIPYREALVSFLNEQGDYGINVLLVGSDKNSMERASIVLSAMQLRPDYNADEDDYYYYEDEEERIVTSCCYIDLSDLSNEHLESPYTSELAACKKSGIKSILFTGLSGGADMGKQLQVVRVSTGAFVNCFLAVSEEQLRSPLLHGLIYNEKFMILHLSALSDAYYEEFGQLYLKRMEQLYGVKIKLGVECLLPIVIARMKKKMGNDFCEEQLAYVLAFGISNARKEDRYILQGKDFLPLIDFSD